MAASKDYQLDRQERNVALKLTHIKTFSCDPALADYYWEVDKDFGHAITEISDHLPADKQERERVIRRELNKLDTIVKKLDKDYANSLYSSLRSYKDQVSRAHRNFLEYFLFPLPIDHITD
jgi:hypothetical protein